METAVAINLREAAAAAYTKWLEEDARQRQEQSARDLESRNKRVTERFGRVLGFPPERVENGTAYHGDLEFEIRGADFCWLRKLECGHIEDRYINNLANLGGALMDEPFCIPCSYAERERSYEPRYESSADRLVKALREVLHVEE